MPKINQTIERLVSPGSGLIINPDFHRTYSRGPDGSLSQVRALMGPGDTLGTPFVAGAVPSGWLPFGSPMIGVSLSTSEVGYDSHALNEILGLTLPPSFNNDNPIYESTQPFYPGLGISVMQGRLGGIMQRLPNGPALAGKKVRIYGAYNTTMSDIRSSGAETPLGVSVWLRSKLKSVVSRGGVLQDDAAATPATVAQWTDAVSTSPSATFTNTSAGDTVWLQNYSDVYQIAAVASPNLTVEGVVPHSYSGVNWTVGRRSPNGSNVAANWHGPRGVHISSSGNGLPAAVLRVSEPGATFHEGTEWYTPGVDHLVLPSDGSGMQGIGVGTTDVTGTLFNAVGTSFLSTVPNVGGTPAADTVLVLPGEGSFEIVDVVSDTQLEITPAATASLVGQQYAIVTRPVVTDATATAAVLLWGAANAATGDTESFFPGAAPPALDGGAAPAVDQAQVWFLANENWAEDPTNGSAKLFEQVATGGGTVQFFSSVVEIPANMTMTDEEMYLVVFPLDPTTIGDLDNMASVFLYFLQVEIVGEAASSDGGTRDRIIKSSLHADVFSHSRTRGDSSLTFREPLWVPRDISLDLSAVRPETFDFSTFEFFSLYTSWLQIGDGISSQTLPPLWFPFPDLPVGSVLDLVRVNYDSSNIAPSNLTYALYQFFGNPPGYSAGDVRTAISSGLTATSGADVRFSRTLTPSATNGAIYRHRLGMPWPTDDSLTPGGLSASGHAVTPARFYLNVNPTATGVWALKFLSISARVWVDARALRGQAAFSNIFTY